MTLPEFEKEASRSAFADYAFGEHGTLNEKELNLYKQLEEKNFFRNALEQATYNLLGMHDIYGGYSPLAELIGSDRAIKVAKKADKAISDYKKKHELEMQVANRARSDYANTGRAVGEFASYALPTWHLGLGKTAVGTAGKFFGADALLSLMYGRSLDEAIENGIIAGATGGVLAGAPTIIRQALEDPMEKNYRDGGSWAGGGKPPALKQQKPTDIDLEEAFPEVRTRYEESGDIRDMADQELTDFERSSFEEALDRTDSLAERRVMQSVEEEYVKSPEFKQQMSDLAKLESGKDARATASIIYRHNADSTFKGIPENQAIDMMLSNNKLLNGLASDTVDSLKAVRDDLFQKIEDSKPVHPDDIEFKTLETEVLESMKKPSVQERARDVLSRIKAMKSRGVEEASRKAKAERNRILNERRINANKSDFEIDKKEMNGAYERYNNALKSGDDQAIELAELELSRVMSRLEPTKPSGKIGYDEARKLGEQPPRPPRQPEGLTPKEAEEWRQTQRAAEENVVYEKQGLGTIGKVKKNPLTEKPVGSTKPKEEPKPISTTVVKRQEQPSVSNKVEPNKKPEAKQPEKKEPTKNEERQMDADLKQAQKQISKREKSKPAQKTKKPDTSGKMKRSNQRQVEIQRAEGQGASEDEVLKMHRGTFRKRLEVDSNIKNLTDEQIEELEELALLDAQKGISDAKASSGIPDDVKARIEAQNALRDDEFNSRLAQFEKDSKLNKEIETIKRMKIKQMISKIGSEHRMKLMHDRADRIAKEVSDIGLEIEKLSKPIGKAVNWAIEEALDIASKNYRDIHALTLRAFNEASRYKGTVHGMVWEATGGKAGKVLREKMTRHLIMTDYESIKDLKTKRDAQKYMNDHMDIYKQAKKEIDLLAKSLKDAQYMNSVDFRGNGVAIAHKVGLPLDKANIIDRLASIKAMDDADWRWVESNIGTPHFELAMDLMAKRTKMSNELFQDNPLNKIKGYYVETYDNIDPDFTWKRGALPTELKNKKKGEITVFPKEINTPEARVTYAHDQGVGIIVDTLGNPKLMRKVASEAYRLKQGKVYDFGEIISSTVSASVKKRLVSENVVNGIRKIIADDKNGLFSTTKKDGFVRLTDEEKNMLPREIRDDVVFVNEEMKQMLMGNLEVGLNHSDEMVRIAQLFVKDTVGIFKEKVVLANPVSYVNNFMFNFMVGMQNGIPPKSMMKYMKESMTEYKQLRNIQKRIEKMVVLDKNTGPEFEQLVKDLNNNNIFKLNEKGFAMSVMSDITSSPSFNRRIPEIATNKALRKIFGEEIGDSVAEGIQIAMLSPSAFTGKFLLDQFTKIDVMGRYSIAKHYMDQGMTLEQAANKSNALFGDLDKITPVWAQAISEFGAIPFASWFYRVSHGLGKNILDNPKKAFAIAGALYAIEEMSGRRTESWNPTISILNTPFDMSVMSPWLNPVSFAERAIEPMVYQKMDQALKYDDPTLLLMSRSF